MALHVENRVCHLTKGITYGLAVICHENERPVVHFVRSQLKNGVVQFQNNSD